MSFPKTDRQKGCLFGRCLRRGFTDLGEVGLTELAEVRTVLFSVSAGAILAVAFSLAGPFRYKTAEPNPSAPSPAASNVGDPGKLFKIGETAGLSGMLYFSASVGGKDGIFVLDLDAPRVRRVVSDPGNHSYPAISPDGARLAFTSDRDGNKEIYISGWDGTDQRRLTNNRVDDDNASWSPNNRWIVYYSETSSDAKDANVFVIDPDNPLPLQITRFSGRNTTPRFDMERKKIAYSTNRFWPGWDICTWSLGEKQETCILTGAQSYCRPRYSPDGVFLAYSVGAYREIDIALLNLKNGQRQTVTNLPGKEYDIAWSADGKHMAFTAENGRKDIFNIFVLSDNKPSTVRPLLNSEYSIRYLDWTAAKTIELEARRIREQQAKEASSPAQDAPAPDRPAGDDLLDFVSSASDSNSAARASSAADLSPDAAP